MFQNRFSTCIALMNGPLGAGVALLLVIGAPGAVSAQPTASVSTVELPSRGVSAHRGASRTHPENTLPAFREAIRLGAHQIELDVYLTKDKQLVIMHDATVDRTTDGKGKIADLTLAEIKQLDAGSWKGPQFAGERVPTLTEALAIMPENVWLNLHVKGSPELGTLVAQEIVRARRVHQAFLATTSGVADAARRVCPEIMVCNMDRRKSYTQYVDETIAGGAAFIQLFKREASPEDMAKLRAAKVRINYCCTDDPDYLVKLHAAGVQFVLVDDLAKMMAKAEQLGIPPLRPVVRGDSDSGR